MNSEDRQAFLRIADLVIRWLMVPLVIATIMQEVRISVMESVVSELPLWLQEDIQEIKASVLRIEDRLHDVEKKNE